jgi:hypothetical protein
MGSPLGTSQEYHRISLCQPPTPDFAENFIGKLLEIALKTPFFVQKFEFLHKITKICKN